jgi:putative endonuclease
MAQDHRRELGEIGERIARERLEARGFRILERNFRTRYGELDLVASDGRFLVFCEVKTRVGRGRGPLGPLVAIGARKRSRVRAMARRWLSERAAADRPHPAEMRFDAVGIALTDTGRLIRFEHVEDAF